MKTEEEQRYWFELGYKCALMPEVPTEEDKRNMAAWFELQQQLEGMRLKHVVQTK